jgi:hypothetical protein
MYGKYVLSISLTTSSLRGKWIRNHYPGSGQKSPDRVAIPGQFVVRPAIYYREPIILYFRSLQIDAKQVKMLPEWWEKSGLKTRAVTT